MYLCLTMHCPSRLNKSQCLISFPVRCGPHIRLGWVFPDVPVVAVDLHEDEADHEESEEDGEGDDDVQEVLAGRRQPVQRVLRLQIMDLVRRWTSLTQVLVGSGPGKWSPSHEFCTHDSSCMYS